MKQPETIEKVYNALKEQQLCRAINLLSSFCIAHPELSGNEETEAIEKEYLLMVDYWQKGYQDPYMQQVALQLMQRLHRLSGDLSLRYSLTHEPLFMRLNQKINQKGRDWDISLLSKQLEEIMVDETMVALENESRREQRQIELYAQHHQLRTDIFNYLLLSPQWSDGMTTTILSLLTSPTIDATDQQLFITAITLSGTNIFDANKLITLSKVYEEHSDEDTRQRALVGWIFMLQDELASLYPELTAHYKEMVERKSFRSDLLQLQLQLINCAMAGQDGQTINKEIIPQLMKQKKWTKDLDSTYRPDNDEQIDDILHTEDEEEAMQQVEESFNKMQEMQHSGVDIYFDGFSKMKQFPFFEHVINWFVPFSIYHPEVQALHLDATLIRLMKYVFNNGAFCNGDKYSLVLVLQQSFINMPPAVKNILSDPNFSDARGPLVQDYDTTAYRRRYYLQDLYRFLSLYNHHHLFCQPFSNRASEGSYIPPRYLFFCNESLFSTWMASEAITVAKTLMKRQRYVDAARILKGQDRSNPNFTGLFLMGYALTNISAEQLPADLDGQYAINWLNEALRLHPNDERTLAVLGAHLKETGYYEQAIDIYQRLMEQCPNKEEYTLLHAICTSLSGHPKDAIATLHKFNYLYPNQREIMKELAWAQLYLGQEKEALLIYRQLKQSDSPLKKDELLPYAFCAWQCHEIEEAAHLLATYLRQTHPNLPTSDDYRNAFTKDILHPWHTYLDYHHISLAEGSMMMEKVIMQLLPC